MSRRRTKYDKERYRKMKKKPGRKSSYREWMLEDVDELVGKCGARNKDLAEYFGVDETTIDYWIKTIPEFKRTIKKARMKAVLRVSQSLFNRAIGYEHPDTYITQYQGDIITKEFQKKYPPDTAAAIKFLSIMMRDVWADVRKLEFEGNLNVEHSKKLNMENLSDEEREALFLLNLKQLTEAQNN